VLLLVWDKAEVGMDASHERLHVKRRVEDADVGSQAGQHLHPAKVKVTLVVLLGGGATAGSANHLTEGL